MEMREKIARALAVADGKDPDIYHFAGKLLWEAYLLVADAVLNAMREPSEGQLAATKPWPAHWDKDGPDSATMIAAVQTDRLVAASIWQAMIDAALSEETAAP